jgi:hypothetical protein
VQQDPSLRKVDKAEVQVCPFCIHGFPLSSSIEHFIRVLNYQRYAQTIDAQVFEASAKSGMNVADIFSNVHIAFYFADWFVFISHFGVGFFVAGCVWLRGSCAGQIPGRSPGQVQIGLHR